MLCCKAAQILLNFLLFILLVNSSLAFVHGPSVSQQSCQLCRKHSPARKTSMSTGSALDEVKMKVQEKLIKGTEPGSNARQFAEIFSDFLDQYTECCKTDGLDPKTFGFLTSSVVKHIGEAFQSPFQFDLYHAAIRQPFDFYSWGNDFFRPMIVKEKSIVMGTENLARIDAYIKAGENVVLYSNHQTEADPQVISILLEDIGYSYLGEKIVCVAGHRVTTDPLAIPFSMGRNLLTIYSKKHMDNPPEEKVQKQNRNMMTLKKVGEQFTTGGCLLWVAPSGGRDRPLPGTKTFVVAPLDPKSVELFRVIAKSVETTKTHFFPLAMFTNGLVPPPDELKTTLGETRSASRSAVSLSFGDEIFPDEIKGKGALGAFVEDAVKKEYAKLDAFHAT